MRVPPLLPITLLAALVAAGCTSGTEPQQPAGSSTSGPAPTQGSADGWLCEDVSPQSLRALAGGEPADPREVVVTDDDTSWVCEAYDGERPLVRVGVAVGEEGREQARALAREEEGMSPGPEYLGESYLGPRLAVGLTLCTSPGSEEGERTPYSLTAQALGDSGEDVGEALRSTLTSVATKLDRGFGCSPRAALEDAAESTTTP